MSEANLREVLSNPAFLIHDVDPSRRRFVFRPTTEDAVRHAAFLDGRTDIWAGDGVELPFEAAEAIPRKQAARYIFHMSFCGSTLLARLLDRPGRSIVLREPDILVKMADWRNASAGGASSDYRLSLGFTESMLFRRWHDEEVVVVKPSSWANNLIDELSSHAECAVFVTIDRRAFATAVLRGGRDRLAYAARLAAHLAPAAGRSDLVGTAIQSVEDPLAKAVRLSLVAHEVQRRLFEQASSQTREVDFALIESDPEEAVCKGASCLGLTFCASDICANVERWTSQHSKGPMEFSALQRAGENLEVEVHHGRLLDDALDWAAVAFV